MGLKNVNLLFFNRHCNNRSETKATLLLLTLTNDQTRFFKLKLNLFWVSLYKKSVSKWTKKVAILKENIIFPDHYFTTLLIFYLFWNIFILFRRIYTLVGLFSPGSHHLPLSRNQLELTKFVPFKVVTSWNSPNRSIQVKVGTSWITPNSSHSRLEPVKTYQIFSI